MSNEEIAELEYGLYCEGGSPFLNVSPMDSTNLCFSAFRKGHLRATYEVGAYYFYGTKIIEKNIPCAIYIWQHAASKGCNRAKMALSSYFSKR